VQLLVVAGPKQNVMLDSISGVALPPSLVGVFYDYLPRLPKFNDTPENTAVVLGYVIAHEMGICGWARAAIPSPESCREHG